MQLQKAEIMQKDESSLPNYFTLNVILLATNRSDRSPPAQAVNTSISIAT